MPRRSQFRTPPASLPFGMRILLEGEATYGKRWGTLEVDLKLGSPTSAAALLSELMRSKLISGGTRSYLSLKGRKSRERNIDLSEEFLNIVDVNVRMSAGAKSPRKEVRSVV